MSAIPSKPTADCASSHRVLPERTRNLAKAHVRIPEKSELQAQIGACLDYARRVAGWTLDQLAAELHRDPRQVARWVRGEETTQLHVVFGVERLREPFIVALALLAGCRVRTTISMRRSA